MNSAAKLHKRGIAVIGATALIATAFGPAAMAWETPGGDAAEAKTGSIGLVDTERTTVGTQGATAVVAGQSGQAGGDIMLVVPATYSAGDYIDVKLPRESDPAKRITWAAVPTVKLDGPYKLATQVNATGATAGTTGSAAEGTAQAFTAATGETVPAAPAVTPTIVGGGYGDVTVRLTFNTTADASQYNAKFALTLGNVKFNLGEKATGDANKGEIIVTSEAYSKAGTEIASFFKQGSAEKNQSVPAAVTKSSITTTATSLDVAQVAQSVGDVTVRATAGTFGSGDFVLTVGSQAVPTADEVTVTFYDASGAVTGTAQKVTATGQTVTVGDESVPDSAVRAVVSGLIVTPVASQTKLDITVTSAGAIMPASGFLAATDGNQTDIDAPGTAAKVTIPLTDNGARLSGPSRYDTAVKVAKRLAQANGGAQVSGTDVYETDNVIIASGINFPDALSASYLSHVKDAPILLVQPGDTPQVVRDFLYEHGVKRVFIVGGTGAVSEDVANGIGGRTATDVDAGTLKATEGKIQVTRLAGANRFATNRAVNSYAATSAAVGVTVPAYGKAPAKTALLANGLKPWDALAAGAAVRGVDSPSSSGLPVILTTDSGSLVADAAAQVSGLGIRHLVLVGGEAVLPTAVQTESAEHGVSTLRLGGVNRFNTAEHVGNFLVKSASGSATNPNPGFGYAGATPFLANGGVDASGQPNASLWADALTAGPLAAQTQQVLALTAAASLPSDIRDLLATNKAQFNDITPLGGTDVVSDSVVNQARAAVN